MPTRKGLPGVERAVQAARATVARTREQEAELRAPKPSLERLCAILEKAEAERLAEGLGPAPPDEWIDAAWAHSEQAHQLAEQRARDRERADSGVVVVDRAGYDDDDEGYLRALARGVDRATARLAELRDRHQHLLALAAEGPDGGR